MQSYIGKIKELYLVKNTVLFYATQQVRYAA